MCVRNWNAQTIRLGRMFRMFKVACIRGTKWRRKWEVDAEGDVTNSSDQKGTKCKQIARHLNREVKDSTFQASSYWPTSTHVI